MAETMRDAEKREDREGRKSAHRDAVAELNGAVDAFVTALSDARPRAILEVVRDTKADANDFANPGHHRVLYKALLPILRRAAK